MKQQVLKTLASIVLSAFQSRAGDDAKIWLGKKNIVARTVLLLSLTIPMMTGAQSSEPKTYLTDETINNVLQEQAPETTKPVWNL